jgi:adenylyl-sulfate kinase
MLREELCRQAYRVEVLDGDEVRQHLSNDLGFTRVDRDRNVRRVGYVCQVLSRNGVIAIAAVISPYQTIREEIRAGCQGRFVEIYLKCPMDVLMQRDVKGLYRKALQGEIQNFTGISDPYEEPVCPELVVHTDVNTPEACLEKLLNRLEALGYLRPQRASGING